MRCRGFTRSLLVSLLVLFWLSLSDISSSAQSSEWAEQRETLLTQLRIADAELKKASESLNELRATLAVSRETSSELRQQLSEQHEELTALSREIESLREQLTSSRETSDQLRTRVEQLQKQSAELNERLDELSSSFGEYRRRAMLQTISAGAGGLIVGVIIGMLVQRQR